MTKLHDILNVRFINESPVLHLIGEKVVNRYFAIFSILVQVRQQRRVLSLLWKSLRSTRNIRSIPEDCLRKLLFVRSTADDTLASYESFVCHFCIEGAWKSLLKALSSANSFNRIFKVHIRYLNTIIENISFGGLKEQNFKVLQNCLDGVSQLNSLVLSFYVGDASVLQL